MASQTAQETIPPVFADEVDDPRARALENGSGWSSSDIRGYTEIVAGSLEVTRTVPVATRPSGATASLRGRYIQRTDNALRSLDYQPTPEEHAQTAAPEADDRIKAMEVLKIVTERARARNQAKYEGRGDLSEQEEAEFTKRISEVLDPPEVIEG